ncbi:MAG TPA: LytTR family DNA-binding domain-containing protein [Rhodothermales bacterium]|nr:LytTR family DNA-binding domain-containing protein [Rhodothermales bacterium]
MEKIRTLIVDDEEPARARLRRLLRREEDVEVIGACADGVEAAERIEAQAPLLVFLDVQMREMGGLQLIERLPDARRPFIILVTAYDQYALDAFQVDVVDYLLKPYSDERFGIALGRAKERIRQLQISQYSDQLLSLLQDVNGRTPARAEDTRTAERTNRLVVKSGSHLLFLDPKQVDWIEAEGVYLKLHIDKKSYLLRESLNSFEGRLDPNQFIRIHRSTIVNMDRIREVVPHANGGSVVMLHDGRELRMSRTHRDRLSMLLG